MATLTSDEQWPKQCTCCDASYDAEAWSKLPLRGWCGDRSMRLEMRNCSCGSTLCIDVTSAAEEP